MKTIAALRHFIYYRPNQRGFLVFLVAFSVTQYIAFGIYTVEKRNENLLVKQEAERIRNRLESALNNSITATKTLAFLVENDLLKDHFNEVSRELLNDNHYIDAVQLVSNGKILITYPLKGNEATIGYTVMENPAHRMEAMKALDRRELYFEGPFELRQGGIGMVGRYPVFRDDTLWGFSAVVIRMKTFVDAMEIDGTGNNERFVYQLEKYPDKNEPGNLIFPSNQLYSEGIYYKTIVPIGDWHLFVKLRNPQYLYKSIRFSSIGLLLSVLLAAFVWYLSVQPQKLRQLVREKTRDLDEANQKLESRAQQLLVSNKELEQFAYIASHDLQEPLRMITGFLNRLEKKYDNQLDEKGKLYIHHAVDGAVRMRQVILDLLNYSRLTNLEGEKEEVDLNVLISDYRVLRQQLISEKRASIISPKLPVMNGYKAPLIQVFHNLLDNALKYTREGVFPEINVGFTDKGDSYEFYVKDNGIGIEEEYFDKIFVIFQRLHDKNEYEGTGMGLAIVSKIVKSMGGAIRVDSQPGVGSTFYFTLNK